MGRLLLQSNAYDDNYTSVADCGHLLYGIYSGNSSEYPYADSMFDLLAAQDVYKRQILICKNVKDT